MVPEYITPWIYTHATAVSIEMLLWLIDQWSGRENFNLKICIEFIGVCMAWMMVCCVYQTILHNSQIEGILSLFKK